MSNLEMTVEAIRRCIPADQFNSAFAAVAAESRTGAFVSGQSVEQKIHSALKELGMPPHVQGYRYVVYAIQLCLEDESLLEAVTRELYPAIAEKFQATGPKVERGIRQAIELVFDRADPDVLGAYFGNTVSPCKGKATNTEFLATMVTQFKLGMIR